MWYYDIWNSVRNDKAILKLYSLQTAIVNQTEVGKKQQIDTQIKTKIQDLNQYRMSF